MSIIDIATFLMVILLMVIAGHWGVRRVQSEKSYLLADNNTGLFALTATLVMTEFNTSTLIAFSAIGYLCGLWALVLPFVFLIGLTFYGITVAKKWKQFNGLSVAQFFSQRYGDSVGKLASFALIAAMTGFSAVYIKSLSIIFSLAFPSVHTWMLSLVLVLLILLLTLRGGLVAIIKNDIISFCILLIFMPLMMLLSWNNSATTPYNITEAMTLLPPSFVVAITLVTMFTYIIAPWYGQKIFSAKTPAIAKQSVMIAAVLVFVLYACAVMATSFLKKNSVVNHDQALPYIVMNILPTGLRGIGFGVFFAAAATTLSGVWSAMTSMVVSDFLGRNNSEGCGRSIYITIAFATIAYLLGNTLVDKILQKLILANIPVLALSFALLAGFYWKKASKAGAIISIVVGLCWGVFTYAYFGEDGGYQWYWAIYGIPLIFGSGAVGSIAFPEIIAQKSTSL
ncbi:MAG: sodium:solute symporter [Waddliaceae bacterium]|jgi:solute:Na+ symporter, SSS family|nr:sodium:solute symporter [Waddliaceae bacterium]MBT3578760.1 sodium:solute symporter [Waddliaceae bacterium]MBT4444408.1 sodium:solute symporter [Waddliaceae bacterium]MBT6927880.1 sodium:solute symporter [Waddliaceae bacterium]MBT7265218.1 sodium:solute symporter [Waddliaceae bacterium]